MVSSTNIKANELSQLIQTTLERLKILQAELKKPFMTPEKVEEPDVIKIDTNWFVKINCARPSSDINRAPILSGCDNVFYVK